MLAEFNRIWSNDFYPLNAFHLDIKSPLPVHICPWNTIKSRDWFLLLASTFAHIWIISNCWNNVNCYQKSMKIWIYPWHRTPQNPKSLCPSSEPIWTTFRETLCGPVQPNLLSTKIHPCRLGSCSTMGSSNPTFWVSVSRLTSCVLLYTLLHDVIKTWPIQNTKSCSCRGTSTATMCCSKNSSSIQLKEQKMQGTGRNSFC